MTSKNQSLETITGTLYECVKKGARLNSVQRALAERIYGSGNDFVENMKRFAKAGINPKVYVLNPNYVQEKAEKGPIARACWLYYFNYFSAFNAIERYVVNRNNALGGVRREEVAEGAAAKNGSIYRTAAPIERTDYSAMLNVLTASPDEAVKAVNDQTASALLGIVSRYYSGKAQ